MNTEILLNPVEDLISATKLLFENIEGTTLTSTTFDIETTLSLINFGCIKDTDNVLIMSSEVDTITHGISYLYTPKELIAYKISENSNSYATKSLSSLIWNDIKDLLSYYPCTDPKFMELNIDDINCKNNYFDVSLAAFMPLNNLAISQQLSKGRFDFHTGFEYDMFEKLLIKSSVALKNDGILLILCTPGWILKAWQLIHDLGFQLEYENYSLYTTYHHHANSMLWLRFTKKDVDFNLNLHKRNILSLMKDNNIDRLFAHRNNVIFPYVELSYNNSESFIDLDQNLEYMQYFFSADTTKNLSKLCTGYTACLVTPSIAKYAHSTNKNVVLFERDNRFRKNDDLKFVKYDLYKGLTKFTANKYTNSFDTVICDPPFDIKLDLLAEDIVELLKNNDKAIVYVIFPSKRSISLINAMKLKGLDLVQDDNTIVIEYAKPPKIVRLNGKSAIQLYKFKRM